MDKTKKASSFAVGCRRPCRRPCRRQATALLVCIFVVSITTLIVVTVLDTQGLQMMGLRNTQEYERATYLAGSAVHHALAQIEAGSAPATPFTIGPIEFPSGSGDTYQADVVDAAGDMVITGTGTAGGFARYLEATLTEQAP